MCLPYITISYAQSIDGKIATKTGDSKYISSQKTLKLAHKLRKESDAVIVGINTVLRDNPRLTCRHVKGKNPVRVVFDSSCSTPPSSHIIKTSGETKTIICATGSPNGKSRILTDLGAEVLFIAPDSKGHVDPGEAVARLCSMGLCGLYLEGGGKLITSFLRQGLVNRMIIVTAPILIGNGVSSIQDLDIKTLDYAVKPKSVRLKKIGKEAVWELIL